MESCSLPPTLFEYDLSFIASSASVAPPPGRYLPSSIVIATTLIASLRALSISSTTCSVPPLMSISTALGFLQPVTNVILSSPIFLSSTVSAFPIVSSLISSRSVTILAPVAFASFSISLCFTLLTPYIPYFAR